MLGRQYSSILLSVCKLICVGRKLAGKQKKGRKVFGHQSGQEGSLQTSLPSSSDRSAPLSAPSDQDWNQLRPSFNIDKIDYMY
jgi:hypothetical protein